MARYRPEILRRFVALALQRAGAPEEEADLVADALVRADLRGVHSHGVVRAGVYLERLQAGSIRPGAALEVVRDRGATVLCDAGGGFGVVAACRAMDLAVQRARTHGVGVVGVRNSNHCGMLAYFVLRAVSQGAVGIALSNADAQVAPYGARTKYLGTNPLSVGIPAGEEPPVVLDMATSEVAHGRVRAAALRGERIPPGWALGPDGRPTTDPAQALRGALLPFGGAKGSGLSLVVDVLAGVLMGARSGPEIVPLYEGLDRPQGVGHLLAALWPEAFCGLEELRARVDGMVRQVRALPPAEGFERVWLPGELEHRREVEYQQAGIPLPEEAVEVLHRVAERFGMTPPEAVG
ncbi:MAG: Ldh family oxidoreductase [Armatimonadota bacterium]|nr:Ldh family oxidoreductase [Armatimonadota bacterium]MDW8155243.1 Ldh family oxidoreductase [Armatimonadota bacterium]